MKLYCGKNSKGQWKASADLSKVEKFASLFECEVPVVHNNKVYMIKTYYGFDYNYGSITNPICDVVRVEHKLYHSVNSARKSELWTEALNKAKENPEKFHVSDFNIASDAGGEPFMYGDVMQDKFNRSIIPVKVIY